jgi:hypothetical protein
VALVVFLRGVNVGGHRIFRPSILAKKLERYDVVSIGAAGTFVVRKPSTRFRAEFSRHLPFETHIVFCDGGDLLRLQNPFGRSRADVVPFVSVLSEARPVPQSHCQARENGSFA